MSRHVVVMGVSGCGKSTVAAGLAERAGLLLGDADRFHPEANIAKMSAGIALDDADRRPWLQALADWTHEHEARGTSTVLACSALRRSYREILRSGAGRVEFVHLAGPIEQVAPRLVARTSHFMPRELLESQYATLEPLGPDEPGITLDLSLSTSELIAAAVLGLGLA